MSAMVIIFACLSANMIPNRAENADECDWLNEFVAGEMVQCSHKWPWFDSPVIADKQSV